MLPRTEPSVQQPVLKQSEAREFAVENRTTMLKPATSQAIIASGFNHDKQAWNRSGNLGRRAPPDGSARSSSQMKYDRRPGIENGCAAGILPVEFTQLLLITSWSNLPCSSKNLKISFARSIAVAGSTTT